MTYKEFCEWMNERACDGCWGLKEAIYCIEVRRTIGSLPFWRRRKAWMKVRPTAEAIVSETNEKIDDLRGMIRK